MNENELLFVESLISIYEDKGGARMYEFSGVVNLLKHMEYSSSPVSRCGWFKGCRRLSWTALGSLKVLLSLSYYSSYNISAKGEMRML